MIEHATAFKSFKYLDFKDLLVLEEKAVVERLSYFKIMLYFVYMCLKFLVFALAIHNSLLVV
jgi:hypothetical protein